MVFTSKKIFTSRSLQYTTSSKIQLHVFLSIQILVLAVDFCSTVQGLRRREFVQRCPNVPFDDEAKELCHVWYESCEIFDFGKLSFGCLITEYNGYP